MIIFSKTELAYNQNQHRQLSIVFHEMFKPHFLASGTQTQIEK